RGSVASSHLSLGDLLMRTGKPLEAEAEFRKALAIWEKLAQDHPPFPDFRNRQAESHNDLPDVLRRLGRPAESRAASGPAIPIREALFQESRKATAYGSNQAWSYRGRGLARRDLGDLAGAATDARRAVELWDGLPSRTGAQWFEIACAHAALAGLAGQAGS